MELSAFHVFLQQLSLPLVRRDQYITLVGEFESFCQEMGASPAGWTARAFITELTRTGRDSHENLLALAHYGRFLNNNEIYVAAFELLDGAEVMGNLSQKLAAEVGRCGAMQSLPAFRCLHRVHPARRRRPACRL